MWRISYVIIDHFFSFVRDWSKHVTWPNILLPKLGDIREYPPIFKTLCVAKKIWRIIKTIASIWGENMFGYLSADIICSEKRTVFLELRSRKTVRFSEQIMSADKYPSIFSRQMAAIVYIILHWYRVCYSFGGTHNIYFLTSCQTLSLNHHRLFECVNQKNDAKWLSNFCAITTGVLALRMRDN